MVVDVAGALEEAAVDEAWEEEDSEAGGAEEASEEAEVGGEEDLAGDGEGEEEEEGLNSRRAALTTPGSAPRSRSLLRVYPRAPRYKTRMKYTRLIDKEIMTPQMCQYYTLSIHPSHW